MKKKVYLKLISSRYNGVSKIILRVLPGCQEQCKSEGRSHSLMAISRKVHLSVLKFSAFLFLVVANATGRQDEGSKE
jgi:hypothetical protein